MPVGRPSKRVLRHRRHLGADRRLYARTYQMRGRLVLMDPGSDFCGDADARAVGLFVRSSKQLGNPETSEAADYRPSVRAYAQPSVCVASAVVSAR